jgi:TRAP-type C4-dicarboxylate transport system permease small subunit
MVTQDASPCAAPETAPRPAWMRGVEKIADFCLAVSMYLLYPAILTVIVIDVIGRNFFNAPLSWAIEGSGIFLIGAIFLAVGKVELEKGHILLDIFYANYSTRAKCLSDMATRFLAFIWIALATVRCFMEVHTSYILGESGGDFKFPFWPMRLVMAIGFLVFALCLLYTIADAYRKFKCSKGGQG